jgi:signal transduction histidine kinase
MGLPNRLRSILLLTGILAGIIVNAQVSDSLCRRMTILQKDLQQKKLKDTDYLRAVDSIAPRLEMEDSLPLMLTTYRDIVFSKPGPGARRASYYTYLALNAYNTHRPGAAIYYAEKNNEEKTAAGLFEKGGLSHSDLFAMSLYYNNRNYPRVIAKYLVLRPSLTAIPSAVAAGKTSPEQAFLALSILEAVVYTASRTGDGPRMEETFRLTEAIQDQIALQPVKYASYRPQYAWLRHGTAFEVQRNKHHPEEAARQLQDAISDALTPAFPPALKADYLGSLYVSAVEFYFDLNKPDSAGHYLDELRAQGENASYAAGDPGFLLVGDSRIFAGKGDYSGAYALLRRAYLIRDSAYYSVSSDRDNNLYALAEAENARGELLRSEENKRSAQQSLLLLSFVISLLVLAGIAAFFVYRSRQQRKLQLLQLHLARDFHDAVGPMLLYANALAKKELDDHPSQRMSELKDHIGQVMESVRSISHDLKTKQLSTITHLGNEAKDLLEKMQRATGIGYTLNADRNPRVLSHLQFTHLSKILAEMVGNSVKHAGCKRIDLDIAGTKGHLRLGYSDDGVGFDPAAPFSGIGLQNVRERVTALNGHFQLNNAWPGGYSILITIPLA